MKNSSFLFCLVVFLAIPFFTIAQKQFLDATITTNDGQTLSGKIPAKAWNTTPRNIFFRTGKDDLTTYEIADLPTFEVVRQDGSVLFFERKPVQIEISPERSNLLKLDDHPRLNFRQDTVWLELLYRGTWDLFYFRDTDGKDHYFLAENEGKPSELILKNWTNKSRLEKVELFRKTLSDASQDCQALLSKITEAKFEKKDLMQICRQYDDCKGTTPTYQQSKIKGTLTGQVLAGVHSSTLNFAPFLNYKLNPVMGWQAGFGLDIYPGRTSRRISLYNELMVYRNNYQDSVRFRASDPYYSFFEFNSWNLGASSLVSFKLFNSSITPTLKLGVFNRIGLSKSFVVQFSGGGSSFDYTSFIKATHELGPIAVLSFDYKRFGAEFRYLRSSLVGGYLVEGPNTIFWGLNLGYRIF